MDHLGVPNSPPSERKRGRSFERRRRSRGQSSVRSAEELHDHWHTDKPHDHYGPKVRRWHRRPQSPGLKWYKEYTERSVKNGRVLVIDYVKHGLSKEGTRKVSAQEIRDIGGLRRLYESQRRDEAVLRVFHVQNADWAAQFLFKKFNIIKRDDLVDSDFGRWVSYKKPQRMRGRPLRMGGKSWPAQHDPWRGISKTAFGLDYLKSYKVKDPEHQAETDPAGKMMELNCYDENTEVPRYGYDLYGQRLCVYIQRREENPQGMPDVEGIQNPYEDADGLKEQSDEYFPVLNTLDNGNAIIIFENSKSESIQDTLIAARGTWESRWRRLPFYLAFDARAVDDDDQTSLLCARTVISDVWRAVAQNWGEFLVKAGHHVEILEAKIYERPADESRADEIWRDSSNWLRCERLAYLHQNLIQEVGNTLREMSDESNPDESWLQPNYADFTRLLSRVDEDLVKPTANLNDLMYKSVGIRDTRHSLELSYSMWRLSWITFIFLPLTFTVGFFGMNVDIFSNDPHYSWFFVASVPLMFVVLVSWYFLKWALTSSRRDPYSRGVYERLYHDLAVQFPTLWTRGGPAVGPLQATTRLNRLKWRLVLLWNDPGVTIHPQNQRNRGEDDRFDGLGFWSRFKRSLTRRWTEDIQAATTKHREIEKGGPATSHPVQEGIEAVQQTLNLSVPGASKHADVLHLPNGVGQTHYSAPGNEKDNIAAATAVAAAADVVPSHVAHRIENLQRLGSPSGSSGRPSSVGNTSRHSGIMVEEREPDPADE